mgnify:CR=1 FL=1
MPSRLKRCRDCRRVVGILFAVLAAGCSPPMQVSSNWGPGVQFSGSASTFDWSPQGRNASGDGRPASPDADAIIRETMERHLAVKGYRKAAQGSPDFWIDYRVARNVRTDPYTFSEMTEGTLALYMVNPDNGKVIWRGCARSPLQESDLPDVIRKKAEQAIKRLLDQVPSHKDGGF